MSYNDVMAETLTVRWSRDTADLGRRLERLSKRTKRPRSYYVTSALADHMDRWEREADLIDRAATTTDAELAGELGWPEPIKAELAAALAVIDRAKALYARQAPETHLEDREDYRLAAQQWQEFEASGEPGGDWTALRADIDAAAEGSA